MYWIFFSVFAFLMGPAAAFDSAWLEMKGISVEQSEGTGGLPPHASEGTGGLPPHASEGTGGLPPTL